MSPARASAAKITERLMSSREGGALATLWLIFALLELAFAASISGSALTDPDLTTHIKVGLATYNLALMIGAVGLVGGLAFLCTRLARGLASLPARGLVQFAGALIVWVAVSAYLISWAAFWNVGVFLGSEGLRFWLPHPIQVFHWVYPPLVVAVLGATAFVTLVVWMLPRWMARLSPRLRLTIASLAVCAASVCLAAAVAGETMYGDHAMVGNGEYGRIRDLRSGPLVYAVADLRSLIHSPEPVVSGHADDRRLVRPPIISLTEYLAAFPRERMRRWNVVMVQVESLRNDQLRAYGGSRDVMPGVDALAKQSRVFTHAFVQSSSSNYADLVPLGSQYPLRSPRQHEYPANSPYPRVLIYEVLKALGYRTAVISSQNERWGGMIHYHRPEALDRFFHAEAFKGPTYSPYEDIGFAEWVKNTGGAGSVDDRYTVDEAIKWIGTTAGTPFFVHMNLQSSHLPYVVPAGFARPFGPDRIDFPIMWARFPRDKVDIVKARYADSLFYADQQISRLFQYLQTHGLWDNTIIIVGGDNGEAFYEHGFASHATWLFNEVVNVPMIVRAPGIEPGPDSRPAMFVDVPPSILDLLGLPPHPGFQGTSLFSELPDPDRSLYMVVQTPVAYQSGIIRGKFKLLSVDGTVSRSLFDLAADPAERTNIASQHPDVVTDLAGRLERWRRAQLDYYGDLRRQRKEYPPVVLD